ncbi:LacI family DNA-binding transcriptional regulator [Jiangella endophytica]|uniref:LacI family DNA-binding transcriptional regulator n=1 Tax=Jiangella endophytica TaxID=1623398 RepID=UPI000E34F83C|nr:LacI family DNA-binding transcriptional regulator [Jiangella endophytica]
MMDTPGRTERRRAPTRTDVARLAGVSTAVVSYVTNDGPRPVAAATREKVLAAMRELDYRPNAVARALRLQRAQAVGLVVPDVSNTYFGALARELSNQAFTAGYALLLGDSDDDPERERAQIESLVSHQIDGLIIVSLAPDSVAEVNGTPTVYLNQRSQPGQLSVIVDNEGGARLAVSHLLGHGLRRIAHLGGRAGAPGADERRAGWEATLSEAGSPADPALLRQAEYSRVAGHEAAIDLLTREPRPDAVFVASDVQALGLLAAARELAISVPHDLAVVSFDGTDDAVFSDPPLTAVEQPVPAIAEAALQAVLGRTAPASAGHVPVRLVVRASCGCPPAG